MWIESVEGCGLVSQVGHGIERYLIHFEDLSSILLYVLRFLRDLQNFLRHTEHLQMDVNLSERLDKIRSQTNSKLQNQSNVPKTSLKCQY